MRTRVESGRWQRIDELFHAAVACSGRERERVLTLGCADDRVLRAEVESLLSAHSHASSFIDSPAFDIAPRQTAEPVPTMGAGQRIGRYTLQSVIGRGGMGVVYEAQQDNPRRIVALKVIRPGLVGSSALRRFEHETQLLARLQHPGIAQIYEAGTADFGGGEQPYFAMELVRGVPLTQYARSATGDGLSLRARLELMARVCDAVEHAHQKGVIHRDLKPGNILVADTGIKGSRDQRFKSTSKPAAIPQSLDPLIPQPKILDFGVARATDSDPQTTTLHTEVGQLVGTVAYMSPEQVAGDSHNVDTRSDVYSLGVLCYELLTGRLPYAVAGKSIAEAARIIQEQDATPLSSVSRTFRGDLDTILAKALEKDRERRYPSARSLAADLRHYLAGEPIEARRESLLYVVRKRLARHRAGVALAGLALLLLLASTWATRQHRQAVRAQEVATVQTRISALRPARVKPTDLEVPGTAAAQAAAAVWARVQEGRATEAELRELIDASTHLDFSETRLLDLSRHAVAEGGFAIIYATRVYACPGGLGFLLRPKFVLDGTPLPVGDVGVFRAAQRRLTHAIHVASLPVGQHLLSGELEVTLARVAAPEERADRPFIPISQPFVRPLGAYRFIAVNEHQPDYPVMIVEPSYEAQVSAELLVEPACLIPEPPLPRQAAAMRDELQVVLVFPPPPLELALTVELRAPRTGFSTSMRLALLPPEDALAAPELVYNSAPVKPFFDPQRCRITLRVPVAMILASANPEALLDGPLVLELSPSRDAARRAGFERFLSVELRREVTVTDARPPPRRQAGALAYTLLDALVSPRAAEARLLELTQSEARTMAIELVRALAKPSTLRLQAWLVVSDSHATPSAFDRALARAAEANELEPDDPDGQHVLGAALYRCGQHDAAAAALQRSLELDRSDIVSKLAYWAMAEHDRGRTDVAEALLERLQRELEATPHVSRESRDQAREAAKLIGQPVP